MRLWDVVIIGAGPAGSSAAIHLARRNLRILLVEAKKFPRHKVCGGCLNGRSWFRLAELGLDRPLLDAGTKSIESFRLCYGDRDVQWSMQNMWAVSRAAMDRIMMDQARLSGVTVIEETTARLGSCLDDYREIELLSHDRSSSIVRAKLVIMASGLTSVAFADLKQVESIVQPGTKIGLGSCLSADAFDFPDRELRMIAGKHGYMGITRVEHGKINIAAAVDAACLRSGKSIPDALLDWFPAPASAIRSAFHNAQWTGTPGLTRSSTHLGEERMLLIGDSAGYVEPFTGEGMSWALEAGAVVSEVAEQGCRAWSPDVLNNWTKLYRSKIQKRQFECRTLAWLLRHPSIVRSAIRFSKTLPFLGQGLIQRITKPPKLHHQTCDSHRTSFVRNAHP